MAKQRAVVATPDQKWEHDYQARQEQRAFTDKENSAFEKNDQLSRVKHGLDDECLAPMGNKRLRVGCFEHKK